MFRILSWISLILSLGVLLVILRQTSLPPIQIDSLAADRVADKMAQLQMAVQESKLQAVALNEAELNQWMRDNLVMASANQAQQAGIPVQPETNRMCNRFTPH